MKPTCAQVQEEWPAFERGELEAEFHAAVAEHLAGCKICQQTATADRAIADAMSALPTATAAADFAPRVRAALRAELGVGRTPRLARFAPLAAAALVLLGIGAWFAWRPRDAGSDRDGEVIANLDLVEQLEMLGSESLDPSAFSFDVVTEEANVPLLSVPDEEGQ
jgi:hypothetical protein